MLKAHQGLINRFYKYRKRVYVASEAASETGQEMAPEHDSTPHSTLKAYKSYSLAGPAAYSSAEPVRELIGFISQNAG